MKLKFAIAVAAVAGLIASAAGAADQSGHMSRQDRLKAMDANGDGKISRQEAIDAAKARSVEMDKNHDGKLTADDLSGGNGRFDPARFISRADQNGDGVVTEKEWADRALQRFDRLDKDKDGFLSPEEQQAVGDHHGGDQ